MKRLLLIMILLTMSIGAYAIDTLRVNEHTTLHLQCDGKILYCDLGSNAIIASPAPGIDNLLRIKATTRFIKPTSVSILTENNALTTYVVIYESNLKTYLVNHTKSSDYMQDTSIITNQVLHTTIDTLKIINDWDAVFNHMFTEMLKIRFNINSIYTVNDKIYITVSIKNLSSISYAADALFMISDIKKNRHTTQDIIMQVAQQSGELIADAGQSCKVTYVFNHLSIAKDKEVQVGIYEREGYRNVMLRIDSSDIAKAKQIYNFYNQ